MALRVGLTGGIASGKSTISRLFSEHGVPIIDADEINHELLQPGQSAFIHITEILGRSILKADGTLNKPLLRQRLFAEADLKYQLEHILHPLIKQKMLNQAEQCHTPYCILAVPLLIEAGWQSLVDRILLVDVSESTQITRLQHRDNETYEQAHTILMNQCSREQRLQFADDIIDNSGQEYSLKLQVTYLHQRYLSLAGE